jgi:hypothetical protein
MTHISLLFAAADRLTDKLLLALARTAMLGSESLLTDGSGASGAFRPSAAGSTEIDLCIKRLPNNETTMEIQVYCFIHY